MCLVRFRSHAFLAVIGLCTLFNLAPPQNRLLSTPTKRLLFGESAMVYLGENTKIIRLCSLCATRFVIANDNCGP